jgi:uncharacterized protein (TIGR03067 family)
MQRHIISAVALVVLTASGAAAADKVKDELKKLQGEWPTLTIGEHGRTHIAQNIHSRLVVEGDKLTIFWMAEIDKDKHPKEGSASYHIKLDSSVSPKTMDLTHLDGGLKDQVLLGLYDVEDNELWVCVGGLNKPRPDGLLVNDSDLYRTLYKCRRPKKPDESTAKELKKFNGTWVMTAFENAGNETPPQVVERLKVVSVFSDGKWTSTFKGKEHSMTYTYELVDVKADPKRIAVHEISKLTGGIVNRKGIYKVDGDVLTLCLDEESGLWPTAFATKPNTMTSVITLKRQKP